MSADTAAQVCRRCIFFVYKTKEKKKICAQGGFNPGQRYPEFCYLVPEIKHQLAELVDDVMHGTYIRWLLQIGAHVCSETGHLIYIRHLIRLAANISFIFKNVFLPTYATYS